MYKGSVAFSAGSHAITPEARAKPLKLINDTGAGKKRQFLKFLSRGRRIQCPGGYRPTVLLYKVAHGLSISSS